MCDEGGRGRGREGGRAPVCRVCTRTIEGRMIPACRQTVLLPFLLKSRGESSSCASRAASTSTLSSAGRAAPRCPPGARAPNPALVARAARRFPRRGASSPSSPSSPSLSSPSSWGLSSCSSGSNTGRETRLRACCDDMSELAGGRCERRGSQVSGRAKEAGEVHDMFSYLWV